EGGAAGAALQAFTGLLCLGLLVAEPAVKRLDAGGPGGHREGEAVDLLLLLRDDRVATGECRDACSQPGLDGVHSSLLPPTSPDPAMGAVPGTIGSRCV